MTRAEQAKSALSARAMDWAELLIEAEEIAEAYEQDFENEITWFEYTDGSVAEFRGKTHEIFTYGSRN